MPIIFAMKQEELPPGKMQCHEFNQETILFANVEGRVYAVAGTCTHEDSPLCLGALKGHFVMCSLHGSLFDLRTGQADGDPADIPLKTYEVEVADGNIYLHFQGT